MLIMREPVALIGLIILDYIANDGRRIVCFGNFYFSIFFIIFRPRLIFEPWDLGIRANKILPKFGMEHISNAFYVMCGSHDDLTF